MPPVMSVEPQPLSEFAAKIKASMTAVELHQFLEDIHDTTPGKWIPGDVVMEEVRRIFDEATPPQDG
jgi:hypothetical protein